MMTQQAMNQLAGRVKRAKTDAKKNIIINQRQVAFPRTTLFTELFDRIGKFTQDNRLCYNNVDVPVRKNGSVTIGAYCTITDYRTNEQGQRKSLAVRCSDKVFEWIKEHMLMIPYDSLHFKVVVYKDSSALVWCEYGQILGSRLLAQVKGESVPSFE